MNKSFEVLDALFPKARLNILTVLYGQPGREWFMRDLAQNIGVLPSTLQREFKNLTEAGVVESRRDGGRVYYRAAESCSLYTELVKLFVKAGVQDVVVQEAAHRRSDV